MDLDLLREFVSPHLSVGLVDGDSDASRPSSAWLVALGELGTAVPHLAAAVRQAASADSGLVVEFSPEIVRGLQNGTFHLMQSAGGALPTAVNKAGRIVGQARVVGGSAGAGAGAAAVAVAPGGAALAIAALPVLVAVAASYAQQRQLEKALESIQAVVDRIEARLRDADFGVIDAADEYLRLAGDAIRQSGSLPDYLVTELASHRTIVEGLYRARARYVDRFKIELEVQQNQLEAAKGDPHPWVDVVIDGVKSGVLDDELLLFVRSLMARSRLNTLASLTLAAEGHAEIALQLADQTVVEMRRAFFDLHRRLVPLARFAPEPTLLQRVPGLGRSLQRTHSTIRALVEQLNVGVLPVIPDPDHDEPTRIQVPAGCVHQVVAQLDLLAA